jgi:asparagine synthase (glutamine-hydrolysing)
MCGIAGIIDFRGRPIDRGLLESFCAGLAHRGPDDAGVWVQQSEGFSVGLAHTRLAVIDPTPEGHQPMLDPSGRYALVYNGELYNYRQLGGELPARPRTGSDTEVVLNACAAWGPDALRRFDAIWAIGFVDLEARTGHLSRDPFGVKPLYYAHYDGRLVFANELATLRRIPDLPTEVDRQALGLYLTLGWIPHPFTICRGVRKLPPGHLLRFDSNGPMEPERYCQLPPCGTGLSPVSGCGTGVSPVESPPDYPTACAHVRELIQSAVDRQMVADVPVGAFLSGGLDSSVVVAALAAAGHRRIKTFSIGYAEHPRYDETRYARLVADHFGAEHHAFQLTFADVLKAIPPLLDHMGEPFADSSLVPTSLVSKYTREHVTVALSGDGGDELFGGYWRYLGHHYLARYAHIPALLRAGLIEPLLRLLPSARTTRRLDRIRQFQKLLRAQDAGDAIDRHLAWARLLEPELAADLLGGERAQEAADEISRMYHEAAAAGGSSALSGSPLAPRPSPLLSPLDGILRADLAIGLPADMLFKVDLASMFHSLEVRVPLLSTDLVEYVSGLPMEYKIRGTQRKRILTDAFRDALPEAILSRRKMGFEVPVGEFLRHELRELYTQTVTPDALSSLGLNPASAARLYDDHLHRRRDSAEALWSLLVLCRWARA